MKDKLGGSGRSERSGDCRPLHLGMDGSCCRTDVTDPELADWSGLKIDLQG